MVFLHFHIRIAEDNIAFFVEGLRAMDPSSCLSDCLHHPQRGSRGLRDLSMGSVRCAGIKSHLQIPGIHVKVSHGGMHM